ncbi:MAG: MBL fold metallo-hydrolase [Candidatus Eisenbacteria bacterium]|uniref:MBL fold metallo-hydrolase n=1 Tax=Eiseniibacteriota bacterium TaxID=2212470 RepID=A0A933W2Z5_UNCEI|nr:MBL fold metallo-hydrolase [Candidatus Eisenbacteria bacterium]
MPTLSLGDWTLHTIEAGALWLDGGAMFGSVPRPLWSRTNPPDERNRIPLAMRCLLLVGHGRKVLVDVGLGDKNDAKFREIFRVEDEPTLEDSLAAAGHGIETITDVVLTHLHFDHAGGSTRREGGTLVPRVPNAKYFVQRRNWENAHSPNPRERASYLGENFDPLAEAGVLEFWDGASKPWPGVEIFTAEGHTRGQQLLRVEGGGKAVYYVADLIPTASHVRIPFVMGYDVAAIETMAEKRALLERASAENAWVCLEHDPVTAFARPVLEGHDFAWAERIEASRA